MSVTLDPAGVETRVIHDLIDFTGKHVLEVGCGDGRLTWRYADRAASVLSLDPDPAAVEKARAALPVGLRSRVTFRVGDITAAELPPSTFDVAILSWSLC